MKANFVIAGIVLLTVAYILSLFSLPWIEWRDSVFPVPTPTLISLTPVAAVFGLIGAVLLICGLTENPSLRFLLSCLAVIACLLYVTGKI